MSELPKEVAYKVDAMLSRSPGRRPPDLTLLATELSRFGAFSV